MILAPYGLSAVLTGQTYKESDPTVQRFLSEWKQIYPITQLSSKENLHGLTQSLTHQFTNDNSSDLLNTSNSVVEVAIAGFKMKYPSCFVYLTDLDVKEYQKIKSSNKNAFLTKVSSILSLNVSIMLNSFL